MDRRERITRHIRPEHRGIELGPYFNPLTPKRLGYNCLVIDIADAETLRKQAAADPLIPRENLDLIEEVDLIGTSTDLASLIAARGELGTFDYVVSSHNLEHLPDPIRFMQGCAAVLKPGGVVSMAVPDYRTCFDYFRPVTVLAGWLSAYAEQRTRPSPAQVFEFQTLFAMYEAGGRQLAAFSLADDPRAVRPAHNVDVAYAQWKEALAQPDDRYRDVHCWTFTPSSLALMLLDLQRIGLVALDVEEVSETTGSEFFVHLRRRAEAAPPMDDAAYWQRRDALLMQMADERGANSPAAYRSRPLPVKLYQGSKRWARNRLRGTALGNALRKRLRG
jgi:SAM-dependent methyltransferase